MMRVFIEGEIEMQTYSLNKSKNVVKISEPEPADINQPPTGLIAVQKLDEPIMNNVETGEDEYAYDENYYEDGSGNTNNNHIKDDDYYDEEEEYYEEQAEEFQRVEMSKANNVLNENGGVVTRACIIS